MAEERIEAEKSWSSRRSNEIPYEESLIDGKRKRKKFETSAIVVEEDQMKATGEEVEDLIRGAMKEAEAAQGRISRYSQLWAEGTQGTVAEFLAAKGPSFRVGELGEVLCSVMDQVEVYDQNCRPRTKASSRSLFPLPVDDIASADHHGFFLQAIAKGLNSLFGEPCPSGYRGNSTSDRALKRLGEILESARWWKKKCPQCLLTISFRFVV